MKVFLSAILLLWYCPRANAEFRSAQDMAKECRVALDVLQGHVEKSPEHMLFTGECIGYVQAATDAAAVLAENVSWYKVCVPESASTLVLIQKFIAFVDKYPKYGLASTAFSMMLVDNYPCRR